MDGVRNILVYDVGPVSLIQWYGCMQHIDTFYNNVSTRYKFICLMRGCMELEVLVRIDETCKGEPRVSSDDIME